MFLHRPSLAPGGPTDDRPKTRRVTTASARQDNRTTGDAPANDLSNPHFGRGVGASCSNICSNHIDVVNVDASNAEVSIAGTAVDNRRESGNDTLEVN